MKRLFHQITPGKTHSGPGTLSTLVWLKTDLDLHSSEQAALCSVSAGSKAFLLAFHKEIKGRSGMMIMMYLMESLPLQILLNQLWQKPFIPKAPESISEKS